MHKLFKWFVFQEWFVIRFSSDKELSPPLTSSQLEDEETGETGEEKEFKVGDQVQAPWNGVMYQGKIEFESGMFNDYYTVYKYFVT